ncbi:MAG TPA: hypothetical protein VM260_13850, partial [Pirellula sp.]|nr:hypothetical protein [Pirellula sp.]
SYVGDRTFDIQKDTLGSEFGDRHVDGVSQRRRPASAASIITWAGEYAVETPTCDRGRLRHSRNASNMSLRL